MGKRKNVEVEKMEKADYYKISEAMKDIYNAQDLIQTALKKISNVHRKYIPKKENLGNDGKNN